MALTNHRPQVSKGQKFWWSKCAICGHAEHYVSWRRAYIDALIHANILK
jgi:hypothetical protein